MLHIGVFVVHVVAVIVIMLRIPGSSCQPYTIAVSRQGAGVDNNMIMLSCDQLTGATFHRRNGDTETLIESPSFIISKTTEGYYFCRKNDLESDQQAINAYPTEPTIQNTNPQNGMWGHLYKAECPHSFGALAKERPDLYSISWTVLYSNGNNVVLNSNTSEYRLEGSNLIILKFTPFIKSLVCKTTVTGIPDFQIQPENRVTQQGFILNIGLEADQSIPQSASIDTSLKPIPRMGDSAVFQCSASVPQIHTVMFEVFGGNITSKLCTTPSPINRSCPGMIKNHPVTITCDYSESYRIDCALQIDNFMDSKAGDVTCKILNGTTLEANTTVGRIVEVEKLYQPEPSRMNNGDLMLNISLQNEIISSEFTNTNFSVDVEFEPQQNNCLNESYTAQLKDQNLIVVVPESCLPQESFRVRVKAPFANSFSDFSNQIEVPTSGPPSSTITTAVITSGTSTPMTTSTPTTSSPPTSPEPQIYLYAAIVLIVVVVIVLVLLIFLLVLVYLCKKHRKISTIGKFSNREAGEMIPTNIDAYNGGQYRVLPQNSPQRSVTPSDDPEISSMNHTELTGLPSSQDSTPSHYSSRSSHCSRSNHSHHSQCTCNCHNSNSYSGSHLEPPRTLPLFARYGYPDVDIGSHSQYHHEQSSIDGAPRLKLIPPTPGTPNTEPFSVPSPGSPNQNRPQNLKFNSASTPGYTSTPVSNEVAVSIAMYLMHKDCPNKANCPTCNLIDNQFQHLMKRYEHSHNKNENRRDSRLKRRRSMRSTPKSLHPPPLGRQRSQSTSHVNADELTLSSNEDSSTDPEPVTEPEDSGRYRERDFSPLPLGALPRDLMAYASDSELATSPSGHVPSPRRQLTSPTKIHLKPSSPAIPPPKETRLPSSDSLPTDESETSSRQGSDSYDVQCSLPLPSQRRSFSGTSGYETVTSSDTESLFLPNKQLPLEVHSSTDTEMHHRRRHPDYRHHHHHSHSKKSPATRSLQNAPRQGRNPSQLGSDYHSNESFHSAKSDMVHYSYHHNYDRRDYQRPSSSSPCRSSRRADHGYGSSSSFITLPHATSQQTDL